MRRPLDRALVGLDRALGWGTARTRVQRVEPYRGGGLALTLGTPGDPCWYRARGKKLDPLVPAEDERIPLCRARAADLAAGRLEVLSWRPGRRIVLSERTGARRILKGYRRGKSAAAADRHQRAQAVLVDHPDLGIARLEDHDEACAMLVFERVPGQPVHVQALDAETFRGLGAGLAALRERADTTSLDAFTADDELGVLAKLRERVTEWRGEPDGTAELHELVASALHSLPPAAQVPTHRDLHDGQLLVADDRPVLLDFDLFARADPGLDPANLTAHFQLRVLQGLLGATQRGADLGARAFLDGLNVALEPDFARRLRAYQAATFLRLALLYAIRPRWTELSPPLLDLARRCLRDLP